MKKILLRVGFIFIIGITFPICWAVDKYSDADLIPDEKSWEPVRLVYVDSARPPLFVGADLLEGDKIVGKRKLRQAVGWTFFSLWYAKDPQEIIREREFLKWKNPCSVPIEVNRKKYGKTTVIFHNQDGTPGKKLVFPPETATYRLGLCMPRTNKTVRVAQYKYQKSNMLLRKLDVVYYDACGTQLFTEKSTYSYTTLMGDGKESIYSHEGCVGINDDGSLLLLTELYRNVQVNNSYSRPNLQRVGYPVYVKYDGNVWFSDTSLEFYIPEDTAYAFSEHNIYSCFINNGKNSGLLGMYPITISCLNLTNGNYQYYPFNGSVWNLHVTDDGVVTVNYRNKNDKRMDPNKTYSIRFQLPKINYLEWSKSWGKL